MQTLWEGRKIGHEFKDMDFGGWVPSKTRWDWRAPIQQEPASVHIELSIVEEDTSCPLWVAMCTSPPNTHMHINEWITELESSRCPNLRQEPSSCTCTSLVECFCHYGFCPQCHVDKLRQHCNLSGSVCRWRQLIIKFIQVTKNKPKKGFWKSNFKSSLMLLIGVICSDASSLDAAYQEAGAELLCKGQ